LFVIDAPDVVGCQIAKYALPARSCSDLTKERAHRIAAVILPIPGGFTCLAHGIDSVSARRVPTESVD
jgi:hypothetical protein